MPGPLSPGRARISTWLLILMLVCAIIAPSATIAQDIASSPTSDEGTSEAPVQEVLPTATLAPSPTPAPTATLMPSPAPTATTQPTPTLQPTASATATSENAVPTVSPTPSPTPSATPSPTQAPKSRDIAPLVATGSGCTQTSASDVVETPEFVSFSCEGQLASFARYYTGNISVATTGWQYRVNRGNWLSTASQVPTQSTLSTRSVLPFTIDLRPTSAVMPGAIGSLSVSVSYQVCVFGICGDTISDYSATLQATRRIATATAADLLLACTPAVVSRAVNQTQSISCTYSAQSSLGVRQVTLSELVIPMPAGWTISSGTGTVTGSTLTLRPNAIISYSATTPQSFTFTFSVTPSCTSSTTGQPVAISSRMVSGTVSNIVGATFTAQVARAVPAPLAVSVQSNALAWNRVFGLTSTTVDGSLRYRVVTQGCTGWNVQISASSFTYSGPHNGSAIPSANLQLSTSSAPIVISGSGSGVTTTSATGTIASPKKVLSAAAGAGIGTFEQALAFQLTIPGRTLAGTYTSTITITSTAAP